ncbi:MAG: nuclear transport factor 2 family protein [Cyclobacteriaceae bacterium]|nr:nuclear transport factor 2 family protein [Cyclobacteriaceae bacterium]
MKLFIFITSTLALFSCTRDRTEEIEQAMRDYDRHILRMDADSIGASFLPDGKSGGEGQPFIIGPDSIANFIKSFQGLKVLDQQSTSQFIELNADSANQKGTYKQRVLLLEKGDTLELEGQFEATWVNVNKSWKLRKMYTGHYTNKKI